jgi:hypothetical protein
MRFDCGRKLTARNPTLGGQSSNLSKSIRSMRARSHEPAVYSLSKKGTELIGTTPNGIQRSADSFLIGIKFVAHQLAINEVFCAAHFDAYIKDRAVKNWRDHGVVHRWAVRSIH